MAVTTERSVRPRAPRVLSLDDTQRFAHLAAAARREQPDSADPVLLAGPYSLTVGDLEALVEAATGVDIRS